MALESLRVFQTWGERGRRRLRLHLHRVPGRRAEGHRAALEGNVALQRGVGIDVRLVAGDELRWLEPQLFAEDLVVAAWEPESGSPRPRLDDDLPGRGRPGPGRPDRPGTRGPRRAG